MSDILLQLEDYRSDEQQANVLLENAAYEIRQLRGMLQVCMDRWVPFREIEFRRQVKKVLDDE